MKNTNLKKRYDIVVLLMFVWLPGLAQHGGGNIEFVENRGQWDGRVKFMGRISIGKLYLEQGGFSALLYHPDDLAKLTSDFHMMGGQGDRPGGKGAAGKGGMTGDSLRAHAYRVRFLGDRKSVV